MKKIKLISIILIVGLILTPSLFTFAAEEENLLKLKTGQPMIVDGDEVEYFEEDGRIVATGNVSITYGDVKLSCDRIEVNTKTQRALCEGNVVIEQTEGVLTGDRIRYDLAAKKGEIIGGEVEAYPWFASADEAAKVDKNEYFLRNGFVTTCDHNSPHYRIRAKEIHVFPNEKVIAKNVFVYIGKVPVLWFPYYYHPVIQSRAKVQFIPGRSSEWGYFLLSAWRFYLVGNSKVDLLLDYRSKKGFAQGANLCYDFNDVNLPGLGKGQFRAYFVEQNDIGTYDRTAFRDEDSDSPKLRKRFQWMHRIDFDPDTVGMMELNKFSDRYFLKDYFYNEYEQSNPVPANYASIISSKENYNFSVVANPRLNYFYTVTQKLPEVKLEIPNQSLWGTPFYYTSETSATSFAKEYESKNRPSEYVNRFFTEHMLSYAWNLGFLQITPFGKISETMYSRSKQEHSAEYRFAYGGGVEASTRFHRTFDFTTNAFGLDINKLRHIVSPAVRYFYTHEPNVRKDKLYQMDSIDGIEKQNGVALSLENKLQTKRHVGGKLQSADIVRFVMSTDYLFRMKKDEFNYKGHDSFSNIKMDLEISPYNWLYLQSKAEIDPKYQSFVRGDVEASLQPVDFFRMDMGYRYEKDLPDSRNQFTFDLTYILNEKWSFGWYERFDLHKGSIEEQQFGITRDLHCWEVSVVYDVDGSNLIKDDYTIWVAFKIKAFPDLQLGLSRAFTKHQPGRIKPGATSQ